MLVDLFVSLLVCLMGTRIKIYALAFWPRLWIFGGHAGKLLVGPVRLFKRWFPLSAFMSISGLCRSAPLYADRNVLVMVVGQREPVPTEFWLMSDSVAILDPAPRQLLKELS